jgi:hypothetical protein
MLLSDRDLFRANRRQGGPQITINAVVVLISASELKRQKSKNATPAPIPQRGRNHRAVLRIGIKSGDDRRN